MNSNIEDAYPGLIIFLLCIGLFIAGYLVYKFFTGSAIFLFNQYILNRYHLNYQERSILESKNSFYRNLNPALKKKFECNVKYFMQDKVFEGREDFIVKKETELMIAAAATQISFGHFPTIFEHFHKIIIHPDKYYSSYTDQYHHGEVHSSGIIKLSWKAFTEGLRIKDDGFHVGFHEMAHALKIEDYTLHDTEHCFLDKKSLQEFHGYAQERIKNNPESKILRDYAFSNAEEFFAVSIEHFFELPNELNKMEPDVFNYLKKLLKLDPLNKPNPVLK